MPSLDFRLSLFAAFMATVMVVGCGGQSEDQLIASATSYLQKQDLKAATVELKAALQKNPDSGQARYLLGKALLESGDAASALIELSKARDLRQSDNLVLPALARAQIATGRQKEVTDSYANLSLTDPKAAAQLKASVASAFAAQGMIDQSETSLKDALQLDSKNADAKILQARLMAGRGNFDGALVVVNEVIAEDPKLAEAWTVKGELLSVGKADFEASAKALRQALAIDERSIEARVALIQLLLSRKDLAGFKVQVGELRRVLPNTFAAHYYRVELAMVSGDPAGAREGAQELLRVAPRYAPALQLAGAVELQAGSLALAQTHLNQALQIAPQVPAVRRLLAEAYLRSGDSLKALESLKPLLDQRNPSAEALGLAAQAYLQNGNASTAELYYSRAAKADPTDTKARVALALMQVANGNAGAGFAQLESLAATDKTAYTDLALISALVKNSNLPAALIAVDRLQTKQPDQPLPSLLRGRIQLLGNDQVKARASFERALKVDPVYFPAISDLAGIDVAEKKPDEARKRFESLLAREPQNFRARLAIADLRERSGAKPEEIDELLVDAVRTNPDEAAPRLALIQHRLTLRQAKSALAAAQDAVAALPDNLEVRNALGNSQWAAGDAQQAISTFQRVANIASRPEPYIRIAEIYINAKDFVAAEQNLQKALEISPKLIEAQRGLIAIDVVRKKFDEALRVAREVQKQRPKEAVGYLMEGDIQLKQSNLEAGIVALKEALSREPSTGTAKRLHASYMLAGRPGEADRFALAWLHDHPKDSDFMFYLGSAAMARKEYAAAEARYRQVLGLVPASATALNNVAWLMLQQGEAGALDYAQRANRLLPDQASIMDTLAAAFLAEKKLPEALEWQQKAVAKAADVPDYRLNLAKLLVAKGDKLQARIELEKLAALGGRFYAQDQVAVLLKGL